MLHVFLSISTSQIFLLYGEKPGTGINGILNFRRDVEFRLTSLLGLVETCVKS